MGESIVRDLPEWFAIILFALTLIYLWRGIAWLFS
jgi:hypothetical protein